MIAIRLRELLAERQESLASVARATGMSYSTLHRLYSGKARRLDISTLDRLCVHLNVSPEAFFRWQNNDELAGDVDVETKLRRWPDIVRSTEEHLKRMEAKYGILPDSAESIRLERQERERHLGDLC